MNKTKFEQLQRAVIVLTVFATQGQDFVSLRELDEEGFPWDCISILKVDTYGDFNEDDGLAYGFDVHDSLVNGLYQLGYVLR